MRDPDAVRRELALLDAVRTAIRSLGSTPSSTPRDGSLGEHREVREASTSSGEHQPPMASERDPHLE
jgi:hypothetical protein